MSASLGQTPSLKMLLNNSRDTLVLTGRFLLMQAQ